MASQLSLKNYNINSSISHYEKYIKCLKKKYGNEDAFLKTTESFLEAMKTAADELKKKHYVKGKENTKKLYEELITKFSSKIKTGSLDDLKANEKVLLSPKKIQLLNQFLSKSSYNDYVQSMFQGLNPESLNAPSEKGNAENAIPSKEKESK